MHNVYWASAPVTMYGRNKLPTQMELPNIDDGELGNQGGGIRNPSQNAFRKLCPWKDIR